jgi:hypothetical protein
MYPPNARPSVRSISMIFPEDRATCTLVVGFVRWLVDWPPSSFTCFFSPVTWSTILFFCIADHRSDWLDYGLSSSRLCSNHAIDPALDKLPQMLARLSRVPWQAAAAVPPSLSSSRHRAHTSTIDRAAGTSMLPIRLRHRPSWSWLLGANAPS